MTNQTEVLRFARAELKRFLPSFAAAVECRIDPSLPPFAFAGEGPAAGIVLRGADDTCVLHAVHTFLEQMGWRFEITGPIQLRDADLSAFTPFAITPAIQRRGIRQHINFPMDISSYTLEEVKEYIRNLARLRYNHISFHSYPNQWIDGDQDGGLKTAGAFFYGQRHDIPEHPLLKKAIANAKTYCIPEIEPHFDDAQRKSEMAIAWLQEVMAEAKHCGLRIQFSFEPRGSSLELTLATCRRVLELYPLIDTLELITSETGGWGEANTQETVLRTLSAHYPPALVESPEFQTALKSGKANFDSIMSQLSALLAAIRAFKPEAAAKRVEVALGVYCVLPEFHPAIFRVVLDELPEGVAFAFLSEHSSGRVADALVRASCSNAEWRRTFIYSWLEFDGTMYLQQNGVPGLERLLRQLQGKVQGLAFNHWRTAENQLVARYAAEACLAGSRPAREFYGQYAEALGIGNPAAFARAHELMAEADWIATNKLFNIGFCFAGCWGRKGLGYFEKWQISDIEGNHRLFVQVRGLLAQCAKRTASEAGRGFLSFLDNRVRCTMLYLRAMAKGSELQRFKGLEPQQLSDAQKVELAQICDAALGILDQYMALHAEAMPDRGCQGTLISLYYTPPAVLKRIREDYAGIPSDQPHVETGHDEPPSPIEW
jgi:hypothetical protein